MSNRPSILGAILITQSAKPECNLFKEVFTKKKVDISFPL